MKLSVKHNGRKAVMLFRIRKLANVKPFVSLEVERVDFINRTGRLPAGLLNSTSSLDDNRVGFAVRSSAVDEDGELSWAGQFVSKLFVARKDLGAAVIECAQAVKSTVAQSYRKVHHAREPRLALFVQEMVDASVAGVIFTDNPANGDKECMVIEATTGTADKLVSGQEEPRRWYVYKKTGLVKRVEGKGGVDLSPKQIKELVQTAKLLNKNLGVNDIEWAFECTTGLLFINQGRKSRSDTLGQLNDKKLSPKVQRSIKETVAEVGREKKRLVTLGCRLAEDVFTDQNIVELLTSFPTTMGFGLFTYCFAHGNGAIRMARNELGYEIGDELDCGFFALIGGQPRSSIIHDAFTYRIAGIPLLDYCKLVNHYLARVRADRSLANYPEVVLYNQNPTRRFLSDLFGVRKGKCFHKAYQVFEQKLLNAATTTEDEYRSKFLPEWTAAISKAKHSLGNGSLAELTSQYMAICELLRTRACRIFVKAARLGFFSYAQARKMIKKHHGKKADQFLNVLTGGSARKTNPNLQFTADLFNLKQGTVTLEEVCERYGHLAQHELEISTPRFANQPETLRQLSEGITESPEHDLSSKEDERVMLLARLFRPGRKHLQGLSDLLSMAQTYLGLREEVKFEYLRGYALLRELAVVIERKLGWDEGRIFYLKPEEVGHLTTKAGILRRRADGREEMRRLHRDVYVPPVSFAAELRHIGTADAFFNTASVLKGIGVTNASVTGEVVIVRSLADTVTIKMLKPGSILVTEQTDPAWAPALAIVGAKGGLVTEVGGLLAHGAIYAREIGFAAVLNVPRATHVLKTGMRVRVDGASGKITIISK